MSHRRVIKFGARASVDATASKAAKMRSQPAESKMPRNEQGYIAKLQRHASETLTLLSNRQKSERERMVVRAFLRCIGTQFSENEIQAGNEEPVDIAFRQARFQIRDILGGRKRGQIWRDRLYRYKKVKRLSELCEPWTSPKPIPFGTVSQVIADELTQKAVRYGKTLCSKLDALVYVDLSGRYLWPLGSALDQEIDDKLSCQNWRSVSMLFLPYGLVLTAKPDAPEFLKDKKGRILNAWPNADGWFDPYRRWFAGG